jgi:glycosyltransferase involved in cell wall biosynthesis
MWLNKMAVVLATNTDTLRLARRLTTAQVEPWFDAALPVTFFSEEPRTFTEHNGPLRLLWVGRMVPRKALPLALDIMTKIRQPTVLTIVGNGLPEGEVRRMISVRRLEGRVKWDPQWLDRIAVRNTYMDHDVLLFTSLRDSCPAQLIESMGLGLPVIILDHHGAKDLVPEGAGIKVQVTTPDRVVEEMAAAVDCYAGLSPDAKTSMSRIGWSFARTLNYTDGAGLFENLYQQILLGVPQHILRTVGVQ